MLEICVNKRPVVTIHGIMTNGAWQKEISPELARRGLIPVHVHFGFFNVLFFILPFTREWKIKQVRRRLRDIYIEYNREPLNVVAHSFGTLLAMEILERENGEISYDRVILVGSIVKRDFSWENFINKKRLIKAVRNERASGDFVVWLAHLASKAKIFGLKAGDSGKRGFLEKNSSLIECDINDGHSGAHNPTKYERWARFLSYPDLPKSAAEIIRNELDLYRQNISAIFSLDPNQVRVNYFALFGDGLHMVPGTSVNMNYHPEYELVIQPGHGGTGNAYVQKNPLLVLKNGVSWTQTIPQIQLAKIFPNLEWVISLPVYSKAKDRIYGVVNLDGLCAVPNALKTAAGLIAAQFTLEGGLERIIPGLDAAFEGYDWTSK